MMTPERDRRRTPHNTAMFSPSLEARIHDRSPSHPSSIAQHPPSLVSRDGSYNGRRSCNCKNSRCLKLYCECFSSGVYCRNCNCMNCHNNIEHERTRKEAIASTLERNPTAFRPKIAAKCVDPPMREVGIIGAPQRHSRGCACKKSGCLKKYCECFQANIFCSSICKCSECKNYSGSLDRRIMLETAIEEKDTVKPPRPPILKRFKSYPYTGSAHEERADQTGIPFTTMPVGRGACPPDGTAGARIFSRKGIRAENLNGTTSFENCLGLFRGGPRLKTPSESSLGEE